MHKIQISISFGVPHEHQRFSVGSKSKTAAFLAPNKYKFVTDSVLKN